jgi:hypothetical protein
METFNEGLFDNIIGSNIYELNIYEYFEKFYSTFYAELDKKFMNFLLNSDYENSDFYIDYDILHTFGLITSNIQKLIKKHNFIKNIDYTETKITKTFYKNGAFNNDLDYKFTLKSFKILFLLDEKNKVKNIKEWISYEECYRNYVNYTKLYSLKLSKLQLENSNIVDNNEHLKDKIIELNTKIFKLTDKIEELKYDISTLNEKAEVLNLEFKENMNSNIIDIKNNINTGFNNIVELNKINKCPNYDKMEFINSIFKMFFVNLFILYSVLSFINYIIIK